MAPFFPVVTFTAYTTSFRVLFARSIRMFAIRMTISRAYRVGTTFTTAAARVFPVKAFVFV